MFKPTKAQSLAKARLWQKADRSPILNPAAMTKAELARHAGTRTMLEWLEGSEFYDWLMDKGYDKAQLLAAADEAIMALRMVATSAINPREGVTGSAVVAAASKILEAAGLIKDKEVKQEAEDIGRMSDADLKKKIEILMGNKDNAAH